MIIEYPDYAFSTVTQIILFFINCFVTSLSYYWGANIILKIYQKNVIFKKKVLFSVISAIVLNIFSIYFISFLNGFFITHIRIFDGGRGIIFLFIKVLSPLSYIFLYYLGIKILGLSNYKSIKIMRLAYVYFLCCYIILSFTGKVFFQNNVDPRGWNYLRDILVISLGTIFIYILYKVVDYLSNKNKLYLDIPDNVIVKDIKRELKKNFLICFVFYISIVLCRHFIILDGLQYILILSILLVYISISISNDYNNIYKERLINKNEHISVLSKSIDEFRGIKQDFNNILTTYSGYLSIKDYENLEKYHKKMIKTTMLSATRLDISKRISENPSFFALLINKLELSHSKNVNFELALTCDMQNTYIDELDFTRIMAILLDNAIEAAEITETKQVSFSSQIKDDRSKLFIISNDTLNDVNVEKIFTTGFTTKEGHMGQGLAQVRNTLYKYGNSTLNVSYYKNIFTIYIDLKPSNI